MKIYSRELKDQTLRSIFSIVIYEWSYRIRSVIGNWEKFFRIKLGTTKWYCPGCLQKTIWADFRIGDGPVWRCTAGCSGEWYRVLTEEQAEEFRNRGLSKVPGE